MLGGATNVHKVVERGLIPPLPKEVPNVVSDAIMTMLKLDPLQRPSAATLLK